MSFYDWMKKIDPKKYINKGNENPTDVIDKDDLVAKDVISVLHAKIRKEKIEPDSEMIKAIENWKIKNGFIKNN